MRHHVLDSTSTPCHVLLLARPGRAYSTLSSSLLLALNPHMPTILTTPQQFLRPTATKRSPSKAGALNHKQASIVVFRLLDLLVAPPTRCICTTATSNTVFCSTPLRPFSTQRLMEPCNLVPLPPHLASPQRAHATPNPFTGFAVTCRREQLNLHPGMIFTSSWPRGGSGPSGQYRMECHSRRRCRPRCPGCT